LPILREPKTVTGKHTTLYMAFSLAFIAGGILICYLLDNVQLVQGQTLNAVLNNYGPSMQDLSGNLTLVGGGTWSGGSSHGKVASGLTLTFKNGTWLFEPGIPNGGGDIGGHVRRSSSVGARDPPAQSASAIIADALPRSRGCPHGIYGP